jgi:hypothetical protein
MKVRFALDLLKFESFFNESILESRIGFNVFYEFLQQVFRLLILLLIDFIIIYWLVVSSILLISSQWVLVVEYFNM